MRAVALARVCTLNGSAMCFASAELGTCFNSFFLEGTGEGNADVAAASARFGSGMQALDEELRRVMDEQVVTQVLEPIEAKLAKFKELKKSMQTREQHRLDYDAYNRNVRSLKEKPSSNPRKLHEKEAKVCRESPRTGLVHLLLLCLPAVCCGICRAALWQRVAQSREAAQCAWLDTC